MVLKGWARPWNAKKWHYFDDDLVSLCKRWMFAGEEAEDYSDNHSANCVECRRKKKRLDDKAVTPR